MQSISNQSVNIAGQGVLAESASGGLQGQPETGGFDFLSFLLGLQGASSDPMAEIVSGEKLTLANLDHEALGNEPSLTKADPSLLPFVPVNQSQTSMDALIDLADMPDKVSENSIKVEPDFDLSHLKLSELVNDISREIKAKPVDESLNKLEKNSQALYVEKDLDAKITVDQVNTADARQVSDESSLHYQLADKLSTRSTLNSQSASESYGKFQNVQMKTTDRKVSSFSDEQSGDEGEITSITNELTEAVLGPKADIDSDQSEFFDANSKGNIETVNQVDLSAVSSDFEVDSSESKPSPIPEMSSHVQTLAERGGGKITVSLNPPELGQVEIDVTAKGSNIEVSMRSDNELTKSMIESGMDDLKAALSSHDLVLTKSSVQVDRDMSFDDHQFSENFNSSSQENHQGNQEFSNQFFKEFSGNQDESSSRSFFTGRSHRLETDVVGSMSKSRPLGSSGIDLHV